jgi:hypothetical protein
VASHGREPSCELEKLNRTSGNGTQGIEWLYARTFILFYSGRRVAKEHQAAEDEPPRKKRRLPRGVQGVYASDMTFVTPENVAGRGGWKVTPLGRLIRPIRMRPEHPLPEQILPTTKSKSKGKQVKGGETKKKRRIREPPTRARRRTIDPLKYGSQQLKGVFLENVAVAPVASKRVDILGAQAFQEMGSESEESSDESEDEEGSEEDGADQMEIETKVVPQRQEREVKPTTPPLSSPVPSKVFTPASIPTPKPAPTATSNGTDLTEEKNATLGLLQSLFGNADWGGAEDLGSDVDMDELAGSARVLRDAEVEDDIEIVPSDADVKAMSIEYLDERELEPEDEETVAALEHSSAETSVAVLSSEPTSAPAPKPSKLKDLFAPREEEGMYAIILAQCCTLLNTIFCSRILSLRSP